MQTIISFSIQEKNLFKDIISILLNNKITIDEIKQQPKQVREVIYKYFYSIDGDVDLSFEDIAKLIVVDDDYEYIKNVPAVYFQHYVLSKLHEQDNPIKPNPTVALNYHTSLIDGWNVNYYMKHGMFDIVKNIKGRSEIVDLESVKLYPELFDIKTLAKRFGMKLSPECFVHNIEKYNYILETLKLQPRKINIPDIWYVNDSRVIEEIFTNHPPKYLPENFVEIIEGCVNIDDIADLYVEWFLTHHQEFPELMKKATSLNEIFKHNIKITIDSCESFNFDKQYITKFMLDYHGVPFSSSKYIIENLTPDNINFKDMKTKDCIAFYNKYYKPTKEFADKVFENKVLNENNYNSLNKVSHEQLLSFYHKHNNKKQQFNKIAISAINKVDRKYRAEFYLIGMIGDFSTVDYDESEHENFVNALLKQFKQGYFTTCPMNIEKLILEPRLVKMQNWKKCISNACFNYLVENNITTFYDEGKAFKYFINHADSNEMVDNFIKLHISDVKCGSFGKSSYKNINEYVCKGLLLNNQGYRVLNSNYFIDNFDVMFKFINDNNIKIDDFKTTFFKSYIKSKSKINFIEIFEYIKFENINNEFKEKYGNKWIKHRHENPPIEIWPETPNRKLQESYKNYVSEVLPKEYVERRFYDYMVRNHRTRSTNSTAIYTLFSNNSELKIIFINDDNILEAPAKKRYTIDVPYEQVKEYMSEELETNDITTLTTIAGGDFEKICGGNHLIDCFVFSDIKNVFKERTPYKHLMPFFLTNLKLKFGVDAIADVVVCDGSCGSSCGSSYEKPNEKPNEKPSEKTVEKHNEKPMEMFKLIEKYEKVKPVKAIEIKQPKPAIKPSEINKFIKRFKFENNIEDDEEDEKVKSIDFSSEEKDVDW